MWSSRGQEGVKDKDKDKDKDLYWGFLRGYNFMKIDTNKQLHQDNLKAEIYYQFRKRFVGKEIGLICEYKTSGCRFDLIAFETESEEAIGIIEVRRIDAKCEPNYSGNQCKKYSSFGVKLFYISSIDKISELLDLLWVGLLEFKKEQENVFR